MFSTCACCRKSHITFFKRIGTSDMTRQRRKDPVTSTCRFPEGPFEDIGMHGCALLILCWGGGVGQTDGNHMYSLGCLKMWIPYLEAPGT